MSQAQNEVRALREQGRPRYLAGLTMVVALLLCLWGMWGAAQAGISRLFSDYSVRANRLDVADAAVKLTPSDAEAHYARALLLGESGRFDEAITAVERALALRPHDYVLWLELGRDRDQIGDLAGALTAFKEATRLAPSYAQPPWQTGNLLLRAGRRPEAFAELRRAVASDPTLFPRLLDLACGAYGCELVAVTDAVQPQIGSEWLALARYFAKHGQTADAMKLFSAAGEVSAEGGAELMTQLLEAGNYKEAYQVWRSTRGEETGAIPTPVVNSGFEGKLSRENNGFGWRLAQDAQGVAISFESNEKRSGARSLRLDFGGASDPATKIVSQLVLVEPGTAYRLTFAARTGDLVTGGSPIVTVLSASGKGNEIPLALSTPLPQGTSGWREYEVKFKTSAEVSAVFIAFQRQECSGGGGGPCPIFGHVWLDDFALQKQ